jgi:hypothetical protein
LSFYAAHRALVRAKVALIAAAEHDRARRAEQLAQAQVRRPAASRRWRRSSHVARGWPSSPPTPCASTRRASLPPSGQLPSTTVSGSRTSHTSSSVARCGARSVADTG